MSKNEPKSELIEYGIKVTMPGGDTMSAAHLLGESWESVRWFASAEARDEAMADMQQQPPYYRRGDSPTMVLEKIDR